MLSKNFTLEEFVASSTAKKKGISNVPTESVVVNLTALCKNVLQPLRDWYGKTIHISSGYRCQKLNALVGGAKNSQHMTGEAADLLLPSIAEGKRWFEYIKNNLPFDQLIWEHSSNGTYWVHVSYSRHNRKQVISNLLKK